MYGTVDIGGTKTLVVVFGKNKTVIEQNKFPTPKDFNEFKSELAQTVANFSTKDFISGGLGIRGNIDREHGYSLKDDILPWGKVPIRDVCEEVFGCPFALENDSKLAGLSEAQLLIGKYRKVIYVTISTGIGSAFIVDGLLDENTQDSEIGKSLYRYDGEIRQLEDFASGKAIVEKYGKLASELDDDNAWKEISENLAIGLINVMAAFTPEVIVLGGGVGSHFDKFKKPLLSSIVALKPDEIAMPDIIKAKHPEEAVIYGCYQLAKSLDMSKNAIASR